MKILHGIVTMVMKENWTIIRSIVEVIVKLKQESINIKLNVDASHIITQVCLKNKHCD